MVGKLVRAGLGALAWLSMAPAAPAAVAETAAPAIWSVPSDAAIRQILANRIDVERQSVGIVVGIIDAKGKRIISYGALKQGDTRQLNGNTVFEIGSVTKVFTSLLLADMVERKKAKLDDPVSAYLPSSVTVPSRDGKQITLIDLATHTSGLAPMPTNFQPADPDNPFADYTVEQMYAFLGGYTLPRAIGTRMEYSNFGVGLLGHALSLRAGVDYGTAVRQRITGPLGMRDTAIKLTPGMNARLATGHDAAMQPVKNWDVPTLPGAGALRSTANDLLTFLAAELGYRGSPLKGAMARQLAVRRPVGGGTEIALGWVVTRSPKGTAIWHNGGTGGYRTYVGFNSDTRTGVVVLANASTQGGVDDIGHHLLTGTALAHRRPPLARTAVAIDAKAKQALLGKYQLAPNLIMSITLEGDQLFEQLTGQQKFAIYPESATKFFLKIVDAQLSFKLGPEGKAESLVLHQNGRDLPAKRID